MKKALSVISVGFLSLSLLAACNGGESETQKELAALKEQLAQQQKQQAERENQEQEHRKQIEQQQREDELYQKAYQDAQEDLQMKQMLEEEKKQEEAKKKQEEAKKKQAAEERKREEAKKKQALEEEPKQKEEARIKQEESPKAAAKPAASQQASKVTEKLVRYPAFVISESGSGSLNLRGGPSISAVSVTQLKDGQQLQVVAETNACTNANGGCWVKVQVGGLTGYVSNAYLQKGHVRDSAYAY